MAREKRFAKKAVKELCAYERMQKYVEPFQARIDAAQSVGEINRIMHELRETIY